MTRKQRYAAVIEYFLEFAPEAETELIYDNPFQLLVAVILSAQCTDKRVNMTTPFIFEKYPDPASLAAASFDDLFPLIKSISYPNNKTRHLIGMAQMLMADFGGEVPMTVPELIRLPGVGRKTANVITSVVDNQPNMAVDTHVFRIGNRLLMAPGKTPDEVEERFLKVIPKQYLFHAHHWLILHGRYTCKARRPECEHCVIADLCKSPEKTCDIPAALVELPPQRIGEMEK